MFFPGLKCRLPVLWTSERSCKGKDVFSVSHWRPKIVSSASFLVITSKTKRSFKIYLIPISKIQRYGHLLNSPESGILISM